MGKLLKSTYKIMQQPVQHVEDAEEFIKSIECLRACEDLLMQADLYKGCRGLSAPQIGIRHRIILVKLTRKGRFVVMVEPEIVKQWGSLKSQEGCLSIGREVQYIVKRPIFGIVKYWDYETKQQKTRFLLRGGMRTVCHEIDHLEGKCLDKVGVEWQCNKYLQSYLRKNR